MPIRPENRARYPRDWEAISKRIRFGRAQGRCECTGHCGVDHVDDPLKAEFDPHDTRCEQMHGEANTITGSPVVLTVAHLDHQPEHNDDDNLLAMCQRCHNRYDAPNRREGIRQRARRLFALGDLFA